MDMFESGDLGRDFLTPNGRSYLEGLAKDVISNHGNESLDIFIEIVLRDAMAIFDYYLSLEKEMDSSLNVKPFDGEDIYERLDIRNPDEFDILDWIEGHPFYMLVIRFFGTNVSKTDYIFAATNTAQEIFDFVNKGKELDDSLNSTDSVTANTVEIPIFQGRNRISNLLNLHAVDEAVFEEPKSSLEQILEVKSNKDGVELRRIRASMYQRVLNSKNIQN